MPWLKIRGSAANASAEATNRHPGQAQRPIRPMASHDSRRAKRQAPGSLKANANAYNPSGAQISVSGSNGSSASSPSSANRSFAATSSPYQIPSSASRYPWSSSLMIW